MGALAVTDRAYRYRANQAIPEHARVCVFCGARPKRIDVAHLDGHEENNAPDNLSWSCRPCNVLVGNVLRNAGMGRKTRQYNPSASGGASNVGEWIQAVGAITPHIDRGDRGLSSSMSVPDAVAMIRATPHHKRSQFWAQLRKHKRARRENPLFGPGGVFGSREYTYDLGAKRKSAKADRAEQAKAAREKYRRDLERQREGKRALAAHAKEEREAEREREREERVSKPAVRGSYRGYKLYRTPDGEFFSSLDPDSWYDTAAQAKRAIDDYKKGRGNPAKFDRCVKEVKRRGGAANAYAVCTAAGTRRKNPSDAAAEVFEEFHGYPSDQVITVKKEIHHHEHLAAAGELKKLVVKGVDHQVHSIKGFKGALLAFDEGKRQLFVEGGDQSLDLTEFGIRKPHELETLGKVLDIDYHTTKTHLVDEGGTATYAHTFRTTNENGQHVVVTIARYPDLIYRVLDEQLEFSGGSYTIKREGIDK